MPCSPLGAQGGCREEKKEAVLFAPRRPGRTGRTDCARRHCHLRPHGAPPITRPPVIKGWGEWRNLDSKTTSGWMVRYWCSMERCGMLLGSDPCISSPTGTPCMF